MSGDWQKTGRILKSNGPDGELLASFPEGLPTTEKEPVYVEFDALPVPFFILSSRPRGTGKYIIRLNDVLNLEDAEELVGRDLFIPWEEEDDKWADGLPTFDEIELEDLEGWTIEDPEGNPVGTVTGYEDIPGNPCVYVASPAGEAMVPLHEDFILTFDPEGRKIRMNLPEGLV